MQRVKQFLKPEWRRLFFFILFLAIAAGGKIQAWAFSDIPPKPPLYDLLEPLPIWAIWMILLMPLALLGLPFKLIGIDWMGGPFWLFALANLIYFYLLSCLIVTVIQGLSSRRRSRAVSPANASLKK